MSELAIDCKLVFANGKTGFFICYLYHVHGPGLE